MEPASTATSMCHKPPAEMLENGLPSMPFLSLRHLGRLCLLDFHWQRSTSFHHDLRPVCVCVGQVNIFGPITGVSALDALEILYEAHEYVGCHIHCEVLCFWSGKVKERGMKRENLRPRQTRGPPLKGMNF